MNTIQTQQISDSFELLQEEIYQNSVDHGWYDGVQPNDAEKLMLMVTEVAEACEALRECKEASDHIPQFLAIEEELADVVIRVFDYCGWRKLDLVGALLAKVKFNKNREYKHGGKKF